MQQCYIQTLEQQLLAVPKSLDKIKWHCKVRLCYDQRESRKQKNPFQGCCGSMFSNLGSGISHRVSIKAIQKSLNLNFAHCQYHTLPVQDNERLTNMTL